VVVPLLLVMTAFVREALGAASGLQQGFADGRFAWLEPAWRAVMQRVPVDQRAEVTATATDALKRVAIVLAGQMGAVARNTAGFVFDIVLALFATFFLLRDSSTIVRLIRRTLPADEATADRLMTNTRELVSVSVTSSVIVAAVQGALGGLVFAAVGIQAPIFWGVIMAFFCLLPFGAWVIWLPAAVLLAATGAVGRALIVAGLGFGIVSAVDNVLRPMLFSGRTSMSGLMIFISLLGGMSVFGALGLVLGPLVIATAGAVLTTYADAPPKRDD
jgi:predicted PurR-regulated permease PerM